MTRQKTLRECLDNPNNLLNMIQKKLPQCVIAFEYDEQDKNYIVEAKYKQKELNTTFSAKSLYSAFAGIAYNLCGQQDVGYFGEKYDFSEMEKEVPEKENFYAEIDELLQCGGEFVINSLPLKNNGANRFTSYIYDAEYAEEFFYSRENNLDELLEKSNTVAQVINTNMIKAYNNVQGGLQESVTPVQ